jgi:hypothetical protein
VSPILESHPLFQYINGSKWQTRSALTFVAKGRRFRIPCGFVTDFASVPRLLWNVLSPFDAGLASVAHDWLYKTGRLSRQESDAIFLQLMLDGDVNTVKARLMYLGVRIGGWLPWGRYRDQEIALLQKLAALNKKVK